MHKSYVSFQIRLCFERLVAVVTRIYFLRGRIITRVSPFLVSFQFAHVVELSTTVLHWALKVAFKFVLFGTSFRAFSAFEHFPADLTGVVF